MYSGFDVSVKDVSMEVLDGFEAQLGVPENLTSCYTARVKQYFIRGHVLASDVRRLRSERPDWLGDTALRVSMSSPGMEE